MDSPFSLPLLALWHPRALPGPQGTPAAPLPGLGRRLGAAVLKHGTVSTALPSPSPLSQPHRNSAPGPGCPPAPVGAEPAAPHPAPPARERRLRSDGCRELFPASFQEHLHVPALSWLLPTRPHVLPPWRGSALVPSTSGQEQSSLLEDVLELEASVLLWVIPTHGFAAGDGSALRSLCRKESEGRKDLGKQIQEPGKSAVTEEAERGLQRVASPHPVTHFPPQSPACGEEAASAGPWGSQSREAAGAVGQPEPWGSQQLRSSGGDGGIRVCPPQSRERAATDPAAPRRFSLRLHEAAAAEYEARGGFQTWGLESWSSPRAGGMVHAGSCWVVLRSLQPRRERRRWSAWGWFPPKAAPRKGPRCS